MREDDFLESDDLFDDATEEVFAVDKDPVIPLKTNPRLDIVEKRRRVEEIMFQKEFERLYGDPYEDSDD